MSKIIVPTDFSPVSLNAVNFAADISALPIGVHQLFIRSKNADGKWSITNRHIMYKPNPASGLPPGDITHVEYFIDTDPGIGKAVPVVVNSSPNFVDFVALRARHQMNRGSSK